MSPAIAPPPNFRTPTASAALIVPAPTYAVVDVVAGQSFPEGIDYERWAAVVQPAPREAFADRLDVLDLFDD